MTLEDICRNDNAQVKYKGADFTSVENTIKTDENPANKLFATMEDVANENKILKEKLAHNAIKFEFLSKLSMEILDV